MKTRYTVGTKYKMLYESFTSCTDNIKTIAKSISHFHKVTSLTEATATDMLLSSSMSQTNSGTLSFMYPHMKKLHGVLSGNSEGQ